MPKQRALGLIIFFVAASAFLIWVSITAISTTQEVRGQAYGNAGEGHHGGHTGGASQSSCAENKVNVQFRLWTGKDTPWVNGEDIKLKVGDYVDVNCFARNGTALLQNPRMTLSVDARETRLPNPNLAEIRKFQVNEAGVHRFSCKNASNTCSDVDLFSVETTSHTSPFCKRAGCSNHLCVNMGADTERPTTCDFKPEYPCYEVAECEVQVDDRCGFTPSATLSKCLAERITPRTPSPSATSETRSYAASDLNKDGKTDIQDYVIFFNAYKQNSGL